MKLYRIKDPVIQLDGVGLNKRHGEIMSFQTLAELIKELHPELIIIPGKYVHQPEPDGPFQQIDDEVSFSIENILEVADEVLSQEEFDAKIAELEKLALGDFFSKTSTDAFQDMRRLQHFANELIYEKVIEVINSDGGGSKPEHVHHCAECPINKVCDLEPAEEFRKPKVVV